MLSLSVVIIYKAKSIAWVDSKINISIVIPVNDKIVLIN